MVESSARRRDEQQFYVPGHSDIASTRKSGTLVYDEQPRFEDGVLMNSLPELIDLSYFWIGWCTEHFSANNRFERVDRLSYSYQINLPCHRRIHDVEPYPTDESPSVFVEGGTAICKSGPLNENINKSVTKRDVHYLIQWKGYGSEYDG